MKDGIQKTHAELKEPRKAGEGPRDWQQSGSVIACGPKAQEEGIISVEPGNSQGCERRATLHRAAAAEEGEGGAGTGKIATWPIMTFRAFW